MKTFHVLSVAILVALCSCSGNQKKTASVDINFGINQVIMLDDVSRTITDSLQTVGVLIGSNQQPELGYLSVADSSKFIIGQIDNSIKLTRTAATIDDDKSFLAVIAVRPTSIVDNSLIKEAVASEKEVLITFNEEGTTKWAEFTKNNIGKNVAFILDEKVCFMTSINGEITDGKAKITGLKTDTEAQLLAAEVAKNLPM